jgi:hypothetical protein
MLRGRIGNTSHAPHLEGHIQIASLNIRGFISFLVDTGADTGVIMPEDGLRLGIPYKRLIYDKEGIGLGGKSKLADTKALITFSDQRRIFTYRVTIGISPLHKDILDAPSLLGRDVLNRMRMVYQHSTATVNLKVISADAIANI